MDADSPDLQELRELRRRVYGPSRDLEHDPAAHARLAELEAVHEPAAEPAAEPAPEPAPDPGPVEAEAPVASGPPAAPSPVPSLPDRLRALLASVRQRPLPVVALILAMAVSSAATSWITREPGDTVAVLPLRSQVEVSLNISAGSTRGRVGSVEFHGLTLSKLPGDPEEQQINDDCLSVQETAGNSSNAVGAYGCGAGEVPARVPINVTDETPAELREAFPLGTTLVFQLEDDVVRVRALTR